MDLGDHEISSDEKIKQNIEMGLLYACKKDPSKRCYSECPEYKKCYEDEREIFFGDDSGLRRLLFGF